MRIDGATEVNPTNLHVLKKVEDSLFLSSFLSVLLVPFLLLQCWIVVSLHLKLGL